MSREDVSRHELEKLKLDNVRLESQNQSLTEIARMAAEFISHDRCEGCVTKLACSEGELDECWMVTEMRALMGYAGIEVA